MWELQSSGGHKVVTFTAWTKLASSGGYEVWKENMLLNVKEGDTILVDVDNLAPNKQYNLKVLAQSKTPSGDIRSQPLYTSGLTRGNTILLSI